MDNLKKQNEKVKLSIVKCSQCHKMLDLSSKVLYCKNCKSYYCEDCLKGHNEIFIDHNIIKTNEYIETVLDKDDNHALLVNPDLDLDDRYLTDGGNMHINQNENDRYLSDLTMLFHETLTSIQENFNEEICKLKAKKSKEKIDNDKNEYNNKIINNFQYDNEKLEKLNPMERLEKIMEIFKK